MWQLISDFSETDLGGSIDVFFRKTKDLLSVVPIPLGTNFSNQLLPTWGISKAMESNLP